MSFPTVRVAAIQATPAILDAEASVDKTVDLLERAAKDGVQLAVFPEVFIPLYESGAVLKGLIKRIANSIEVTTIGEPHEVAAFNA